jgi:competence protein ComEA
MSMIRIHPQFKKILFFLIYLIALSIIYSLLDVDINYIKEQNKLFYEEMSAFKTTEKKMKKDETIIVSLNKATKSELMQLPFIGPKTADKILDYRKNNSFNRIEDIMKIKGIGKKRFIKLKKNLIL